MVIIKHFLTTIEHMLLAMTIEVLRITTRRSYVLRIATITGTHTYTHRYAHTYIHKMFAYITHTYTQA